MRAFAAVLISSLLGCGSWACGGSSTPPTQHSPAPVPTTPPTPAASAPVVYTAPDGKAYTKADLCCGGACGTPPGYCCTGVCCPGKPIWNGPKWKIGDPVPDPAEAAKAAQ